MDQNKASMHIPINTMDKSIIDRQAIFRETRFRLPGKAERECGLWVDRIGAGAAKSKDDIPRKYRILGQYAAVAIESGEGRFLTRTHGEWAVKAGDVIVLTPEEPGLYHPENEWYTRWIVWNGPEARTLERLGFLAPANPIVRGAAAAVRRAFFSLVRIVDREDLLAALDRKTMALQLVGDLARARIEAPSPAMRNNAALETIIAHIRQHLDDRLGVKDLARLCNLSEPQFRRVFHRFTGRSPVEFVTAQRMAKAKELLARGMPIKQVAVEVGCSDPCYFMRVFKAIAGEPAGRFARNHHHALP